MMKRSQTISLLLALGTVTGCAANTVDDGYDDGNGGVGSGSDDAPVPLTPEGTFAMHSTFDIATGMPGTAGAVVNAVIDATDSADDPTHWILDQLVNQLPAGSIKNTLQGSIPFVAGYLNDRLFDVAPDFLLTVRDLGNKFGQVARNFGTFETVQISANGAATKIVNGLEFTVDQTTLQYSFADYSMQAINIPNLTVGLDVTGKLTISEHKLPLSYGRVMRIALDEMVIPMIDPTATTLPELLKHKVNCAAVGQYVYEAIDIGTPSTFESACNTGLQLGGQAVYGLIDQVDGSALEFNVNGIAKGVDNNADGKMDKIQTGAWTGTLAYAGTGAPLSRGTFIGQRAP